MLHLTASERERERGRGRLTWVAQVEAWLTQAMIIKMLIINIIKLIMSVVWQMELEGEELWFDLLMRRQRSAAHMWQATFICNMRPGNVYAAAADECQCSRLCRSLRRCCWGWGFASAKCLASCIVPARGRGKHSATRLDSHLNLHYKGNTNCALLFVQLQQKQ